MLKVEGLAVAVGDRVILRDINLEIRTGETHVLFGPNGSGKSTLLGTLVGFSRYKVLDGRILFKGQDITHMAVHERARRGIGLSFQRPPTIRGLSMRDMVHICARGREVPADLPTQLNFERFMDREVNLGFSGGEMKRSELLQLIAQDPDLVLLDEPESGVDLENIDLIGRTINRLLDRGMPGQCHKTGQRCRRHQKSGLVITHTGYILQYVNADVGHVMFEGRLACSGNPLELFNCIQQQGYGACIRCEALVSIEGDEGTR
ncbi:MAG: ABC transporter ATP-binding protein [Thermoanaerobacterales bacterium]|nr:ABC transporter ATP-binding protein [Bacillota bacterium]MDI6906829.1 ABC transporter ATP-binding protein [Thermoanaerobacterales bacterium]